MLLSELISVSKLTPVTKYQEMTEICGISSNSNNIKANYVFFCIDGIHAEGHDYARNAKENGAIAIVAKHGRGKELLGLGVQIFEAEDTRASLAYACDAINGYPSKKLRFVAVTGTNGKTTISFMLRSILEQAGYSCGLIGTLGCFFGKEDISLQNFDLLANMTTPDSEQLYPILAKIAEKNADFVIMEASSHASAQKKLAPLRYEAAVLSNFSQDHIDFHKTMQAYMLAKTDILLQANTVILNADCDFCDEIRRIISGKNVLETSFQNPKYTFYAKNISQKNAKTQQFYVTEQQKTYTFCMLKCGIINNENALSAIACARTLGVSMDICKVGIAKFSGVPGRFSKLAIPCGYSVYIDYAHTPVAIEKLIITAKEIICDDGRIILLFGCGGDRDIGKRAKMARAAEKADYVILTSDNPRSESRNAIISDVLRGFDDDFLDYCVIPDRKCAIEHAIKIAKDGDIILLAGKGHEKYEIDKGRRLSFDEERIALDVVEKMINEKNSERLDI